MELLFLGTSCAVPNRDNGSTSFLVKTQNSLILVDASDNPVKSMLKSETDPLDLDLIILTHYHADHFSGYPALISTLNCLGRKRDLMVITNRETEDKARNILDLLDLDNSNLLFDIDYTGAFSDIDIDIELIPGFHTVPTSMIRFREGEKEVFYSSDTAYSPKLSDLAKNCRLLIHEATFSQYKRLSLEGHSSAYEAGLSAKNANAEELFLCHICENDYLNPDSIIEEAKEAFSGKIVVPRLFKWYTI